MDKGYELHRLADPQFHDAATIATVQGGPSTSTRPEPACGWRTTRTGGRLVLTGVRNMTHLARGSSGELVTVFPVDEQRFERIHRAGPRPRRP